MTLPDRESLPLDEADLDPDPFVQFDRWYRAAVEAGEPRPDAMALATADTDGRPSVRIVVLKDAGPDGFVFYTNRQSPKGRDLAANPHAALAFHWPLLHRQVRLSGTTTELSAEESAAYFATRPRDAQIAGWASPQSEVIEGRAALEARFRDAANRFEGAEVPVPPFWGGYRVIPATIEFWQGRDHRLHDRLRFRRDEAGGWIVERLAP